MAGTVAYGEPYAQGRRAAIWIAQVAKDGVKVTYEDEPYNAKFSGSRGEQLSSPAQLLAPWRGELLLASGRRLLRWSSTVRMEPELVGSMPGRITAICPGWPLAGDSRGNIRIWSMKERRGNSYPVAYEMGLTAPIVSLGYYTRDRRCLQGCIIDSDDDSQGSCLLVGVSDEVLVADLRRSTIEYGFPVAAPPRLLAGSLPRVVVGGDQGVLLHDAEHARETVLLAAADAQGRYRPTALDLSPHGTILAAVQVTDPAGDSAGTELFRWDWSGKLVRRDRVAPPHAEIVHIISQSSSVRGILLVDSTGAVHTVPA